MKFKRSLTLLLAGLIFCIALVACQTPGATNPTNTTDTQGETTTPSTSEAVTTEEDTLTLPDGLYYEDYEFKILSWAPAGAEWQYSTFNITPDDIGGDRVSEACYRRNEMISELLGVTVSEDPSGSAIKLDRINQIVLSEPDEFDIVLLKDRFAFSAACEGLIVSYSDLPHVSLEKAWWYPTMNAELSLNDEVYFAYGNHNLDTFNMMQIMLFNAQYVKDLKQTSPYELVKKGEWTLDQMYTMAALYNSDVNADQVMTADDNWGIICSQDTWYPNFGPINGHGVIVKDEDKNPMMNVLDNETLISIWQAVLEHEKAEDMVLVSGWEDIGVYNKSSNRYENAANMFAAGKSLFLGTFVGQIDTVIAANMKDAYGIIPFPTYEEIAPGESYVGYMYGAGNAFCIPNNASDLDRTSAILEAIAYYSYSTVLPELYETKVLVRGAPDDDARDVLIMLNNNRFTDLSVAYWFDIGTAFNDCFRLGENTFVSKYGENNERYNQIIEESLIKLEFNS